MFVTTKVKLAAGLATGALALGAAGAYAAANNTITVTSPKPITVTGGTGTTPLSLISVSGKTTTLTLPTNFKNQGECVSTFAKNKDLALAPTTTSTGPLKLSKNYHGKLVSAMTAWCKQAAASKTSSTDSADVEQSAAPTPDSSDADSSDEPSANGLSHGHGHGQAHGRGHSNA
jgi:hypothetical protein